MLSGPNQREGVRAMNAQSTSEPDPPSTATWEAAPSERSTVGARACAKNVYNSFLDEVARKSGPGAGPEENVRRFEVSPPGAATTSRSSGLSASRRRLGRSRLLGHARAARSWDAASEGHAPPTRRTARKKPSARSSSRPSASRKAKVRYRPTGRRSRLSAGSPGPAPARGPARPRLGYGKRVPYGRLGTARPGLCGRARRDPHSEVRRWSQRARPRRGAMLSVLPFAERLRGCPNPASPVKSFEPAEHRPPSGRCEE
jgi:hypothetical protein